MDVFMRFEKGIRKPETGPATKHPAPRKKMDLNLLINLRALLSLLDQGIAEDFPGQGFGHAIDFFERLIKHGRH